MTDITSGCTIIDSMVGGVKLITLETANTADDADTLVLTLKDFGIKTLLKVDGAYQSTESSVAVVSAFTTSVSSGVLTITLDSTAGANKVRVAQVWGLC
jgi:hypothetical protein